MRILITAGPTREHIDPVRYLSNASSGRMGFALATAARQRGHEVTLVHGPVAFDPPDGLRTVAVVSAAEMLNACVAAWSEQDALLMTAAVADYTPAAPLQRKLKKAGRDLILQLRPTADILATLAAQRGGETSAADRRRRLVIGFALEDFHERSRAERKLRRKGLDAIVLNGPANIGSARAAVEVLTRGGPWQKWRATTKPLLAVRLVRLAETLWARGAADVDAH